MDNTLRDSDNKKILTILGTHVEVIKIVNCAIYTTTKNNETWLYSNLEGLLSFCLDYRDKTAKFIMFDKAEFVILFKMELYKNFINNYIKVVEDFHCFEFGNGFIGFKFPDSKDAKMLSLVIEKFDDNFIEMLVSNKTKKMTISRNDVKKKFHDSCAILKEIFNTTKNYDENYIEEGLEIIKPRHFELLNKISFNKEKKEFKIGHVSDEYKKLFRNVGIKKSDFKNPEIAMNIMKSVIDSIDDLDGKPRKKTIRPMMSQINNIKVNKHLNSFDKKEDIEEVKVSIENNKTDNLNSEIVKDNINEIKKVNIIEELKSNFKSIDSKIKIDKEYKEDKIGDNYIDSNEGKKAIKVQNKLSSEKIEINIQEKEVIDNLQPSKIPKIPMIPKVPNIPIPTTNANTNIIPKVTNIPKIPKNIPTVPKVPLNKIKIIPKNNVNFFNLK